MSNPSDKDKDMKQAALDYHSIGQKGKIVELNEIPHIVDFTKRRKHILTNSK